MPPSTHIRSQALVLCIALAICAAMIYEATRLYLGWKWGGSHSLAAQVRGAELVPGNAEAWDRLGRALESNFDQFNPERALAYFKKSVSMDPHSAEYWLDLAASYELNGDTREAKNAYAEAQRVYPISAEVAWQYGNFLLREGESENGLGQIRAAVGTNPALLPLALSRVSSSSQDLHVAISILPKTVPAYLQALVYFSKAHQIPAALEIWRQLLSLHRNGDPLDMRSVFLFLDALIAQEHSEDALRVWREALAAAHLPQAPPSGDSLSWNGGFEVEPANGGLGWRIEQPPGAYISLDSTEAHSGRQSLRVDFTGGMNLNFAAVSQFVPVHPDERYAVSGYIKTRDISTESGVRLEVSDTATGKRIETNALTGSHDWTLLSCTITAGPNTQFIEIHLRRFPSALFENQMSGTAWLDDVSVVRASSSDSANGAAQ